MRKLGVIPARYASSRLPAKPLAIIGSKPMIQWVYERCVEANCFTDVVVATDSDLIKSTVESFGGQVLLTSDRHESGTARVIEVAEIWPNYDCYINIQGDQPLVQSKSLLAICKGMEKFTATKTAIVTLVCNLTREELINPTVAKVVIDKCNRAIYFSRNPIPHIRDFVPESPYLKHIGIYGFTGAAIKAIKNLPISYLEEAEKLEQLTWLYHNIDVWTVRGSDDEPPAVDTFEDLETIRRLIEEL